MIKAPRSLPPVLLALPSGRRVSRKSACKDRSSLGSISRFVSARQLDLIYGRDSLNGSTIAPFPHPAHRTGQADFPHPALGQDFTLSRATPSTPSVHFSALLRLPISSSFTTYCVCLELRTLPSTVVTPLQRKYESLR